MTANETPDPDGSPLDALDDPDALLDRDDLATEIVPGVVAHQHHFDLYDPIEAMLVVGVTDDDGRVLLVVHEEPPVALLPHATVDSDDGWAATATAAVAADTGVDIAVDGVVGVRRKQYTPEDPDDDRETTADQVFVAASPVEDAASPAPTTDEADRTVGWYDEIPVAPEDQDETLAADIRRFLD